MQTNPQHSFSVSSSISGWPSCADCLVFSLSFLTLLFIPGFPDFGLLCVIRSIRSIRQNQWWMKLMAVQGKVSMNEQKVQRYWVQIQKKTYWLFEIEQKKMSNSWGNSMTFSFRELRWWSLLKPRFYSRNEQSNASFSSQIIFLGKQIKAFTLAKM